MELKVDERMLATAVEQERRERILKQRDERDRRLESEMREEAGQQFDDLMGRFDKNKQKMKKQALKENEERDAKERKEREERLKKARNEEKEEKERVLAQIAADKAERQSARKKPADQPSTPATDVSSVSTESSSMQASQSSPSSASSEVRLMIRQLNGSPLYQTFNVNSTLQEVRMFVENNRCVEIYMLDPSKMVLSILELMEQQLHSS
mgnify:CR=1 FL=1